MCFKTLKEKYSMDPSEKLKELKEWKIQNICKVEIGVIGHISFS